MKYRKGYKYQLACAECFQLDFTPTARIDSVRIKLSKTGLLTIKEGYAWDGASGPVVDRKTNMRASLAHDALYQLMRMELLDHKHWKDADKEFGRILREDGAWTITVKIDLMGLSIAKGKHAKPKNRKKVFEL